MTDREQQELKQLDHAFIQLRRRMDAEWTKGSSQGLNALQARILVRLNEDGPQKASSIAEQLFVTPGAITGIADKLMEMGLIVRERAEEDRRVVLLSVTDEARQIVRNLKEKQREIRDKMFSGLSRQDVGELTRLLMQINRNMDEANKGKPDSE
ncbi:DNA-binding MarR family transcriptional regulator [Paenibacillus phyllosphaerae]|uniref:DNA-binding MarR family transcriptional regulator n=1 Tax=Paenibacillus phyllosphaerae TaxID=274593 RepID=A0A7W5FKS1_9BACL|nr:MarR family transcriptional regulator [Paenibacillus phyllosphaerae]MBB3108207.1 DNA-binding MarR family transcriptional regulator [Paenibacillus phyllosphaerae]